MARASFKSCSAHDRASAANIQALGEVVKLYTANNGWFLREEEQIGTIEPGKLADVVVLSDDSFHLRMVYYIPLEDLTRRCAHLPRGVGVQLW